MRAAVLLLASTAAAWEHISPRELTALRQEHTLVAYASQALEPEWAEAQTALSSYSSVHVASIDCSEHTAFCDDHDVASFPAIRLLSGESTRRYRGPRRAHDIAQFVPRALRPTLSFVDDTNRTALLASDDVVFVAALGDDGFAEQYASLAETYGDRYTFGWQSSPSSSSKESSLECFHDGNTYTLPDAMPLPVFVARCATPLVAELTRGNELFLSADSARRSLVHCFYRGAAERRACVDALEPIARAHGQHLLCTVADARTLQDLLGPLGLRARAARTTASSKAPPLLAVHSPSTGKAYPYTGGQALSASMVEAFLAAIVQGGVQPWGEQRQHDEL